MKLTLKTRTCKDCSHEAVVLTGAGTDCANCLTGEYEAWCGSQEIETDEAQGKRAKKLYQSEVISVSED